MPEPFRKLSDPSAYVACDWNLSVDPEGREHWIPFFKRHFDTILNLGVAALVDRGEEKTTARRNADRCREEFRFVFNDFADHPAEHGRVTILTLDRWRDAILRKHGFIDPFLDMKNRENEKMLPLLPTVCRELDSLSGKAQLDALIRGIFAGNIFDMGAEATANAFLGKSPDFFATRDNIKSRPWLIDDYDALSQRLLHGKPHRKAVFFIDNAGSDFVLGAIPFIRWLAMRNTAVIIAANDRPTLNDMTLSDAQHWWPRILEDEPSLTGLPIELVGTGTGEPLIDLLEISPELNTAADDADLVILEGMGRGVESNLHASFTCDVLNIAMLKDPAVAKRHGGRIFDVVCKFTERE